DPISKPFNLAGKTTAISGTVTDLKGVPVAGAKVIVALISMEAEKRASSTLSTTCDESGKFHFDPVKRPDDIWITAVDASDTMAGQDRFLGSSPLMDLRIKIFPGAKIKGQIVDTEGAPIANIKVGVLHTDIWNPKKPLELANGDSHALTNNQGEFLLSGLQPGTLFLDIIDEEWVLETRESIVLRAGVTMNLSLLASRGLTIEGLILGADRKPIKKAQIVIKPERGGWRENKTGGIAESDENGRFELLGLKPGFYTVYADGGITMPTVGPDGKVIYDRVTKRGVRKSVVAGSGPIEIILRFD
ncbi:MAG: protocatechuate 3,4-dioxygenase beta subunit, partial [Planctomycetota bacterium]